MLSIVVCSRNKVLTSEFVDNIDSTIGVNYEIVHIDNSENKHSISEAYNIGYQQSQFPYLCFVHEDVRFHSQGWGKKILFHLDDKQTGVIGVAGADIVHRIPMAWNKHFSPGENILQTDKEGKNPPVHLLTPRNYSQAKRTTVTLDGLFLCLRKELMDTAKILFDEKIQGFHGYDYDISLQATVAGYQNYIIYDILLEHFSGGKTNQQYFKNLIYIYRKYEKYLPIIGNTITKSEKLQIESLERKNISQLTKKMVRKGFTIRYITTEIGYFANQTNNTWATFLLEFRIILIRLFNSPQYLFKH